MILKVMLRTFLYLHIFINFSTYSYSDSHMGLVEQFSTTKDKKDVTLFVTLKGQQYSVNLGGQGGTNGVRTFKCNEKNYYFKSIGVRGHNPSSVFIKSLSAVTASQVLNSIFSGEEQRFPEISLGIEREARGIKTYLISEELEGFQTCHSLSGNHSSPFFNDQEERFQDLGMLYIALYLVGAGDLHSGNIAYSRLGHRFGDIDLDDAFRRHFSVLDVQKLSKNIFGNIKEMLDFLDSMNTSEGNVSSLVEQLKMKILDISCSQDEFDSQEINNLIQEISKLLQNSINEMRKFEKMDLADNLTFLYNLPFTKIAKNTVELLPKICLRDSEGNRIKLSSSGNPYIIDSSGDESETKNAHVLHDMDCAKPCKNFLFRTTSDVPYKDLGSPGELFWEGFNFEKEENQGDIMTAKSLLDAAVFVAQRTSRNALESLIKDTLQEVRGFELGPRINKNLAKFFDSKDVFMEEHKLGLVIERFDFLKHLADKYLPLKNQCNSAESHCQTEESLKNQLMIWCKDYNSSAGKEERKEL